MWCIQCNDSPMIASPEDPSLWECIECRRVFYIDGKNTQPPIPLRLNKKQHASVFSGPLSLKPLKHEFDASKSSPQIDRTFDLRHNASSSPHFHKRRRRIEKKRNTKRTPILFWLTLLLGVVTFTCGGSTIAWSLLTGSDTIWQVGIPIAFAGQAILFVTFVLQLDWLTERTSENVQLMQKLGQRTQRSRRSPTLRKHFLRETEASF